MHADFACLRYHSSLFLSAAVKSGILLQICICIQCTHSLSLNRTVRAHTDTIGTPNLYCSLAFDVILCEHFFLFFLFARIRHLMDNNIIFIVLISVLLTAFANVCDLLFHSIVFVYLLQKFARKTKREQKKNIEGTFFYLSDPLVYGE